MHILVVSNQFPSKYSPFSGIFVYDQIQSLKNKNEIKEITILIPNYFLEEKIEKKKDFIIFRFNPYIKINENKSPLLRNLFAGVKGKIHITLFFFSQLYNLLKILKKENIDLIHAHWVIPSGITSILASMFMRKKIVLTSHGSDISMCDDSIILKLIVRFALKNTDFYIPISNQMRNKALEIVKETIPLKRIYLGVHDDIYDINKPSDKNNRNSKESKFHIVFVGFLYPIKGIDFLLKIIKDLSLIRNDFIFDIVGDGELMLFLKNFINKNNLYKYVKIHGSLTHFETLNIIKQSDLAIQTSKSEGLSVFLQEAVYFGLPVVATDVGGTCEIVKDRKNGFLIKYGQVKKAIEDINLILNNSDTRNKFSKKSMRIAQKKLNSEISTNKILKIYKSIVKY